MSQANVLGRQIRKLMAPERYQQLPDRELLGRFVRDRDEAAFAALVRRHGPMVLSVCQRVLHHGPDAEDACQATFLVLARKARSSRWRESVANWLYKVAYQLALRARTASRRRAAHESRSRPRPPQDPLADITLRELQAVLDDELTRLPAKYRAPLILCCLEGTARDEAAQQLGWTLQMVKDRLERGRELLRARLTRRGLTLSAALAGISLIGSIARAALPIALVNSTSQAAALLIAGKTASGVVSAEVATLVHGMSKALVLTRLKMAAVLVLGMGMLAAAAGALTRGEVAAQPAAALDNNKPTPLPLAKALPAAKEDPPKPVPGPALDAKGDGVILASKVLDPDGQPLARAEVTVWWYSHHGWVCWHHPSMHRVQPHFGATSAADGSFRFTFAKRDIRDSLLNGDAEPWRTAIVVAAAKGYGPAWASVEDLAKGDQALRLVKDDIPIRGRVLDLQGRPVAGAAVQVSHLKKLKDDYWWLGQNVWAGLPEKITTGKDGRFVVTGIGRERTATLVISSPAIETKVVSVATRTAESAMLEVVAGPTKVILGTVRAKDTGKPLAGAWVYGRERDYCNGNQVRAVRAVTDREGRYRLVGLPKAGSYELTIYPGTGQDYLATARTAADSEGLKPLTADFALRRGIWVHCRMIDKETGQPVRGTMQYEVADDNPYYSEAVFGPGVIPSREFMRVRTTDQDGVFRFVAYPGPGAIFANAGRGYPRYLLARLRPEDRDKGRFPLSKNQPCNGFVDIFQGYCCVDSQRTGEVLNCTLELTRGRTVQGALLGPDGKPVTGAEAHGLTFDASAARPDMTTQHKQETLKAEAFTALGLYPGEPRTLSFEHKGRQLIGYRVVNGTEKEPVTVRLQAWGTFTGRLVDAEGKPRAGVLLALHYPELPRPGMKAPEKEFVTGRDGQFRVEGLLPGLEHELTLRGETEQEHIEFSAGETLKRLTAASAQTRDLGAIKTKEVVRILKKKKPDHGT